MTVSVETALFENKGLISFEELLKASFQDSSNKIKLYHLREKIFSNSSTSGAANAIMLACLAKS
jgi:hypothetical protein